MSFCLREAFQNGVEVHHSLVILLLTQMNLADVKLGIGGKRIVRVVMDEIGVLGSGEV